MGVFQDLVTVVNRAPIPITVTFDGQEITLQPGENPLPKIAVRYAKNQNPIKGTADLNNPHISGAQYLLGVKGTKDCCDMLTPSEWAAHQKRPSRYDEQAIFEEHYGADPKARMITAGARTTMAKSLFEQDVKPLATAGEFGRD